MSYNSVASLANDADMRPRLIACAAIEHKGGDQPDRWVQEHIWTIAATPGWGDSYGYAVAIGKERPGYDESVITDAMILAAVQPIPA